jgi:hypothetical protein
MVLLWEGAILGNCGANCVIVGWSNIGEIVVNMCYCRRENYWGNNFEHGVIVGGSKIGGIVVNKVLL